MTIAWVDADWLYAHDPTTLFAGIAAQARRVFGIRARQVHVDTTSFSVSGAYVPEEGIWMRPPLPSPTATRGIVGRI